MQCLCPIPLEFYAGRDNPRTLVIANDRAAIADLSGVTRVTVQVGEALIDSDLVDSRVIDWTGTVTYQGQSVDALRLALGGQPLDPGLYEDCELVIYDADHPGGLRIEDPITVWIRA